MVKRERKRRGASGVAPPAPAHAGARVGPADFSAPWVFTPRDLAFPTNTTAAMPTYAEVSGFSGRFDGLFGDWFFRGLSSLRVAPKPGISSQQAINHIRFIMGGLDSRHEHKEAAVRYLLDKWFQSIEWTVKGGV